MTDLSSTAPTTDRIGMVAAFPTPTALLDAIRQVKSHGYRKLDTFTPFPIHEVDHLLSRRQSPLAWWVLAAGVGGGVVGMLMQWWTNAVDYPYLISGKPLFAWPVAIPVTFEMVIFAAAATAFVGMLFWAGLGRLANPILSHASFQRASDDRFLLLVSCEDERFDDASTREVLTASGAMSVEIVETEKESAALPQPLLLIAGVLLTVGVLPPLVVASLRGTTSESPRFHNVLDMDQQPKFKPQTKSTLFADGRSMRPRVAGTVARGELSKRSVATGRPETGAKTGWRKGFPIAIDSEEMSQGRIAFNVHCAVCHGRSGRGNGLVSLRALELQQGTWVPPTSLHAKHVREQPEGQIFHSITHGIRKMPGYGHQIPAEKRWAIVAYIRALQRSQAASIEDVPPTKRDQLRELN